MDRHSDIAKLVSAAERMALSLASLDVGLRACASSLRRIDLTMRGEPIPTWLLNLDEVQEMIDEMLKGLEQ